jgi:hypothetical protein
MPGSTHDWHISGPLSVSHEVHPGHWVISLGQSVCDPPIAIWDVHGCYARKSEVSTRPSDGISGAKKDAFYRRQNRLASLCGARANLIHTARQPQ